MRHTRFLLLRTGDKAFEADYKKLKEFGTEKEHERDEEISNDALLSPKGITTVICKTSYY
jgi:hypothetical protein